MAKKNTEETTALATVEGNRGALAVAEGIDASDARGKGNITKEDTVLPRLAICQALSPEKDEDDAKFIDGIKEGDLFNSLTQTLYGRNPVQVAIIDVKKRAIEFEKGPDGKPTKNIIDWNVPWDDPRCEFTDGPNGTRIPPIATRFYDFIAYIPETMEPVVLSMSKTKIPKAKALNGLLGMRPGPAWAGLFKVTTAREEKNGNKYFNYKIQPAGPTPADVLPIAESLYKQFENAVVKVDQGTEVEHDAAAGDKVPF